ncbi:Hypothetical protein ETEE_1139 [Edwardsiella anguillarum ET080813]|uniref:Uncharacterized protein n=1 Tax=Edwardsiella anguillarum ET080813 TaxID=667120 RepID=A0A076LLI2_9GAMM|nr:Hypothetical protein ETEE_1139 [Edwardsiella anguillarum ET080813]
MKAKDHLLHNITSEKAFVLIFIKQNICNNMIYSYLSINHDAFDCMRCYFRRATIPPGTAAAHHENPPLTFAISVQRSHINAFKNRMLCGNTC